MPVVIGSPKPMPSPMAAGEGQDQLSCTHATTCCGLERGPQTLTWLWAAAHTTDICRRFSGNTGTDINTTLGCIGTTNPLMALISCMDLRSQRGLRCLHMLLACHPLSLQQSHRASRHQAVPQTAYVHMDLRLHCNLVQQQGPDTHMVSGGSVDHSDPSRRSSPDSEPFLILGLQCCPKSGGSHGQMAGLKAESAAAYAVNISGSPYWASAACRPQSSYLTCHLCHVSIVQSSLCLSIFPISPAHIC